MNVRPPPVTAERTTRGLVRVSLDHQRGSPHADLEPAQARQLAAELLIAADADAHRTAQTIGDGLDVFTQGVDLFQKVRGLVKSRSSR